MPSGTEAQIRLDKGVQTVPHVAGADIAAGEVVIINNTVLLGIARIPIANGALGALDVALGIYEVKVATANTSKGAKVYWDNSANAVTTTSTNNTSFGFIVDDDADGAVAANTYMDVMHWPF